MPDTLYRKATPELILDWLQRGVYSVEGETVRNRHGELVAPRRRGGRNAEKRWQVRLYAEGCRACIALHRLVWMNGANSTVPPGWEIHHCDENADNNAFDNLLCLHPVDHKKVHDETETHF